MPGGVVHELPADLRRALIANATALNAWKDITPLARNEFICWVDDAKREATRERRIRRTQEELEEGQRRPCCWPGCKHRERTGAERPALTFPCHRGVECGRRHAAPTVTGYRLDRSTASCPLSTAPSASRNRAFSAGVP